jgi:hypothetical protein
VPDLDELFSAASVVGEETENVDWFVISHDFRTISIPSNKKLAGVTSDEKVNRLYFKCPKYYGDVDLSDFSFRINYRNGNGEGDQYLVTDKDTTGDDITFTWLVGRNACRYPGSISFIVCAVETDVVSVVQREYNTAIHTLQVVQGLETSEDVHREVYDVVAQLQSELDSLDDTVTDLVNDRMQEIIDLINHHTAILG